MIWRVATSKHLKDSSLEIEEKWSLRKLMDGIELLECLEALEQEAVNKSNNK